MSAEAGPLIGYCHECDRQVEINRTDFSCSQCNGGFIELFEMDSQQQQQQQQQRSPGGGLGGLGGGGGIRMNTITLNDGQNFSDLFPMLFPQMFAGLTQAATATATGSPQQQMHSSSLGETGTGGGAVRHRFQLIVPERMNDQEQFDLYGIINNVISDLIDPRRTPGATPGAAAGTAPASSVPHFHFQAPPMRLFQLHGDLRDYAWGTNGLDTIITHLLNQLENTGPPPASEDQLQNLPEVSITQEQVESKVQCAICMDDFNLNDKARKLPCRHLFHQSCIVEWLKLHGTCPVCRKNLNGEDTSQREYISRAPPPNQTTSSSNASESSSSSSSSSQSNQASSSSSNANTTNSSTTNSSSNPTNTGNTNNNSANSNSSRSSNAQNFYYDTEFD